MSDEPAMLDQWLGAAGFVHADIDLRDWMDADDGRDDPWADATIELAVLTDAQRRFLIDGDDLDDVDPDDDSDAAIIDIPVDLDDIEPFDR